MRTAANMKMSELHPPIHRAQDKREYLMIIFSYFSLKPYVVTSHLNCLDETVQMRGHNICFYAKLFLIIIQYSLLSRALHMS